MPYDPNNVFAKIVRGEIPCTKVYENEFALSLNDIRPQAPIHILVIPKGPYATYGDFILQATSAEILDFNRAIARTLELVNVSSQGYRLISNTGVDGRQDVPHFHMHILAGRDLGSMLAA